MKHQQGRQPLAAMLLLLMFTLLVLPLSLRYGSETLSFHALYQALNPADDRYFALMEYRLPRTLLAMLVGAALAVSGVLVQGAIRNPLASPEILGVNHAAGLMSIAGLMLFPALSAAWLPLLAFAGALLAFLLLRLLAGGSAPLRLALLGVALTAFYASITDYLMLSRPLEINQALLWLTGSLWGRSWPFIWLVLPWLVVICIIEPSGCGRTPNTASGPTVITIACGPRRVPTRPTTVQWPPGATRSCSSATG